MTDDEGKPGVASLTEQPNGRRRFFREMIGRGAKAAADAAENLVEIVPRRRRPPGAVDELSFLARCTACFDCVNACPHHAIFTLASSVFPGPNTPVMIPDERACHMCTDWPCVSACTTGALISPTEVTIRLGVAEIVKANCFVFRGPECGACGGLCPDGVDALHFRAGKPSIDPAACVGCGLCIAACPTSPKAIALSPPLERSMHTSSADTHASAGEGERHG